MTWNPVTLSGWQGAVYGPMMEYMNWTVGKYIGNIIPMLLGDHDRIKLR